MTKYLAIGFGIASIVLGLSLAAAVHWAFAAEKGRAKVAGEFAAFKVGVEAAGKKAEDDAEIERNRQKRENDDATKRFQARVSAANARADELCKRAGISAGCRDLPAPPSLARAATDEARDQQLLGVLRHAQKLADQVIEILAWDAAIPAK